MSFTPVSVDRIIADGEAIELGETRLTVLETPGHTAGSSSYTMRVREDGRDYAVAIDGSQYGLHDKYEAGQAYSPETFVDPEGFLVAVERLEKLYLEQIAAERR